MQVTRNRAIDVTPKKQKKSGNGLRIDAVQQRDYVYWDDPNELVDCLRLLDVLHHVDNNAHTRQRDRDRDVDHRGTSRTLPVSL